MLNIPSWNCSQNPSSQRMKRGREFQVSVQGQLLASQCKKRKNSERFYSIISKISKRRRNRRRLQCGSSDFGLFFFSKVPLWHAARFGRCQSSAVATSRDFGSIEAWQTVVAWQKLWTSRWIDAGSWYNNASLKMPKSSRRHQYCTILCTVQYMIFSYIFLWCFAFACFCLQILVSASSASLSWWFQNKNCAAGQRGCWMTETSAWRLLGAAACLTARRFPWKKQRSQRPRHHSCPKLWQLRVIMHHCISYSDYSRWPNIVYGSIESLFVIKKMRKETTKGQDKEVAPWINNKIWIRMICLI